MRRARSASVVVVALSLVSTALAQPSYGDSDPCQQESSRLRECVSTPAPRRDAVTFGARFVDLGRAGNGQEQASREPGDCRYRTPDPDWDRAAALGDNNRTDMGAVYYWIDCPGRTYLRYYYPGRAVDPVADGLLTEFVQEAFDRVSATPPVLAVSPGDGRPSLVGVATWLAIEPDDWEEPPLGAVTAGPITVTAWLEPEDVTYELGNGDVTVCEGPGNVYDPALAFVEQAAECSYVYTTVPRDHTGDPDVETYPVSATVGYTPRYRVEGFPGLNGEYRLDRIEGPTATAEVTVHELRAVRVAN